MLIREIKNAQSLLYLQDNARKKYGQGQRAFIKQLEGFVLVAEDFLHSPRKLGSKIDKQIGFELSLTLCGEKRIQQLNQQYRNKDKVTDVLSFPLLDSLRHQQGPSFRGQRLNLGDIVICRDVTMRQAKRFNISYEQELLHLLLHGFLHLCGFDHEKSSQEEVIMQKHETGLVKKLYQQLGYE